MLKAYQVAFTFLILLKGLGEAVFWTNYEYIQDVGWLRLHFVPATWTDARLRCNIAGDILASPTTSAITTLMKTTMSKHQLTQGSVFVDIHAFLPEGDFISIDGEGIRALRPPDGCYYIPALDVMRRYHQQFNKPERFMVTDYPRRTPLSNISLKWTDGEPNNLYSEEDCIAMTAEGELADVNCESVLPYFCLKKQSIRKGCDTTSRKFKLELRTGSCYRFHRNSQPWTLAEMICAAENAHLAVINSAVEAEVLKEIFAENPHYKINGEYPDNAHLGFWDYNESSQWLTIFGESLDKAGYKKWGPGKPNNPGVDNCGSLARSGTLNNVDCSQWLPFICECSINV